MVREAEENAEADKGRRALVEAKNQAEAMVHSTEKAMAEHGSKVGDAERTEIETALADLKAAQAGEDVEAIQAKTQALAQASMKLGEAMYKASQEEPAPGDGEEAAKQADNEDVVDADFEEIPEDEQKKSA
jgi:molecular chaperone DnaK